MASKSTNRTLTLLAAPETKTRSLFYGSQQKDNTRANFSCRMSNGTERRFSCRVYSNQTYDDPNCEEMIYRIQSESFSVIARVAEGVDLVPSIKASSVKLLSSQTEGAPQEVQLFLVRKSFLKAAKSVTQLRLSPKQAEELSERLETESAPSSYLTPKELYRDQVIKSAPLKGGSKSSIGKGSFGQVSLVTWGGSSEIMAMKRITISSLDDFDFDPSQIDGEGAGFCLKPHSNYLSPQALIILNPVNKQFSFITTPRDYFKLKSRQPDNAIVATLASYGGKPLNGANIPSVDVLSKVARGVLCGLGAIHAQNVIHFDLKPDNVVVDETWVPKIVDWGLAAYVPGQGEIPRSCGTPNYMSPEVAKGAPCSAKTDVWSYATLLLNIIFSEEMWIGVRKDLYVKANKPSSLQSELETRAWRLETQTNPELKGLVAAFITRSCLVTKASMRASSKGALEALSRIPQFEPTEAEAVSSGEEGVELAELK